MTFLTHTDIQKIMTLTSQALLFCPRRKISNPSRIDYVLASENTINKTFSIKIEIGPHVKINSDRDYLQLDMLFGQNRKSREDRRKHFRFADYLL